MVSGSPGFRVSVVAFTWWGYYRTGSFIMNPCYKIYIQLGYGSGTWTVVRSMKQNRGEGNAILGLSPQLECEFTGFYYQWYYKKKKKKKEFSLTTKVLTVTHGGLAKLFI